MQHLQKRLSPKDQIAEPLQMLLSTGAVLTNQGATTVTHDRAMPSQLNTIFNESLRN